MPQTKVLHTTKLGLSYKDFCKCIELTLMRPFPQLLDKNHSKYFWQSHVY